MTLHFYGEERIRGVIPPMHVLGENIHLVKMKSVSHFYAYGLTHEHSHRVTGVVGDIILVLLDS
jgi:hypothetical protein